MDIVDIISIALSVVALIISAFMYHLSSKREKRQLTIEEYNKLQEQALDYFNTVYENDIKEIAKDCKSIEYKNLCSLIAKIDHYAVCVNEKVYDEEIFLKISKRYFYDVYDKLKPIVDQTRKKNKKSFKDFELLADKVKAKNLK